MCQNQSLKFLILPLADKAQANVQTLISNDCGVTWELIKPGQTIPKRMVACELSTTIPGSPMVGGSNFKTTFDKDVKAKTNFIYVMYKSLKDKYCTKITYIE